MDEKREYFDNLLKKKATINFRMGPTGIITSELPEEIHNIILPFGTFTAKKSRHEGEEENDYIGWSYSFGAIGALIKEEYKVSFNGKRLFSAGDARIVEKWIELKKKGLDFEASNIDSFFSLRESMTKSLNKLFMMAEDTTEADREIIEGLPIMVFPKLGVSGPIADEPSGWMHQSDEYLYIVNSHGSINKLIGLEKTNRSYLVAEIKKVKLDANIRSMILLMKIFEDGNRDI